MERRIWVLSLEILIRRCPFTERRPAFIKPGDIFVTAGSLHAMSQIRVAAGIRLVCEPPYFFPEREYFDMSIDYFMSHK